MEIWRVGYGEEKLPAVISRRTLALALLIHLAFFIGFWLFAVCHGLFDPKEEIIPIDLTVVVNENLNGKENEPPPLKKPEPEPPKPKPKPKPKVKEPEKPKELEKIVTNIVTKVDKKDEKKASEKPKKESREERMKRMRESAVTKGPTVKYEVKTAKKSGNGRTEKQPKDWEKYFNQGYKPGAVNQLAASDAQLGYSLIKMAFEEKWEKPPWTSELRPMTIRVWFGGGGTITKWRLESSSGDARADQSIKSAASRVGTVQGLPPAFIDKYRSSGVPVRFTVKPQ